MGSPIPPGLVTGSFGRVLTPAQVHELLNALIEGAPFAASLTRAPTSTGVMAFPTVGPTGWSWLEELQEVPRLTLDDKSLIVAVKKIIGALPISSEMLSDASVNVTNWVGGALGDSLSRDLDLGLLNGSGGAAPNGIIAQADEVSGATLTAAAGAAIAAIGEKGGAANTIALSPTAYADELTAVDANGRPIHPDGLDTLAGLRIVQVPGLAPALAYDARRCYLVLGSESNVTLHDDPGHDATLALVKARANVGVPVAAKSIRSLTVGDAPPLGAEPGGSGDEGRRPLRPGRGQGGAEPELHGGQAGKRGR